MNISLLPKENVKNQYLSVRVKQISPNTHQYSCNDYLTQRNSGELVFRSLTGTDLSPNSDPNDPERYLDKNDSVKLSSLTDRGESIVRKLLGLKPGHIVKVLVSDKSLIIEFKSEEAYRELKTEIDTLFSHALRYSPFGFQGRNFWQLCQPCGKALPLS